MSKDLIIKNNNFYEDEVIDTPETEIIEENFYVDEKFLKNKELIRMDMNLVQYPIFSKNTKRKVNQIVKYYFNANRDTYITVKPTAGNYIPGEMEEKVFIALMQIMKERSLTRKFLVTSKELKDRLKIKKFNGYAPTIKNSLLRLSETNYNFKNTMYSSEKKGTIKEEISTPILTLRVITLSLHENREYREAFQDKRIKEIFEISISEHFYKNIIQKGYMVYNSGVLLNIETSTARTIYMLIEKMRFDNLYLKLDALFLIKRIPLKHDKKNIARTIKILEKALNELQDKNLIRDFNFIKDSTWEKSEIEINFLEGANSEKQERFYDDRNYFNGMLKKVELSETEHHMIDDIEVIDPQNKIQDIVEKVTKDMVEDILNLMPKKAKELKTMPKAIKEAIEIYGLEKVKSVSRYMKKQKVDKVRSYFLKALENNWIEDEVLEIPEKDVIKSSNTYQKTILDFEPMKDIKTYDERLYIQFEDLPKDIQDGIESYAYRDYIKECGMETKIQQIAFKGSRKKYICEFLEKHPEILDEPTEKDKAPVQEEYLTDIDEVIDKIKKSIKIGSMVNKYSDDESEELLKNISKEVISLILDSKLTKGVLEEILMRYIGL